MYWGIVKDKISLIIVNIHSNNQKSNNVSFEFLLVNAENIVNVTICYLLKN